MITIPAYLLSEIMARVVVVRPRIQISQVSAMAAMQIWYWLTIFVLIPVFLILKLKFEFSKERIITLILYAGIGLNIAFVAAANKLALSKVPLPPGDIRGDNRTLLLGMIRAQETGWSGNFYPPVWLSLVGNIARITDNSVLEVWKPVYLISVVLFPGLVLIAWRQAFSPLIASAFTFLLTFGTIEWKGLANLTSTAILIAIAYRITFIEKKDFKFDIKIFTLGILFGLATLTYYGYLWWSLFAIAVLVIGLLFFKKREYLLINLFDAGLGFLLTFAPSQIGPRLGLSGLNIILLILAVIAFRLMTQYSIVLSSFLSYLTAITVPLGVLFIVATTRNGDTWKNDLSDNSPAPNLGLGFNTGGLFFTILTMFGLILAFKNNAYKAAMVVSVAKFLSAALMMFWFAAQMEITDKVELYPRAAEIFYDAWTLLTLIGIFAILSSEHFENFIKTVWPKDLPKFQNVFLALVLIFPFVVIHARTLSERQDSIFPIGENAVWHAYRACDNPHENPELARVFEEQPFIQKYLRENCLKVDWPVIPPMNWVNVYPGTKEK